VNLKEDILARFTGTGSGHPIFMPDLTLWGGIPQDFLVKTYSEKQFETAVLEAARQAMEDSRVILGVADRVPVNSEFARLKATAPLITDAGNARA
jgi:hypothetical protein